MTRILLLLAFVFSAMDISAQAAKGTKTSAAPQMESTAPAIVHVDQFLQNLQGKGNAASHVRSLLNDAHPSSYVENGAVKTYGSNPLRAFTDTRSLSGLDDLGIPATVEILTVKITNQNDLSAALDFSALSNFPRLQYVHLVFEANIAPSRIVSAVKNIDPKLSVFYSLPTLH